MASKRQIGTIHALKTALSMDSSTYRAMLADWGVATSLELTHDEARRLINTLSTQGIEMGVWQPRETVTPRAERARRGYAFPSQKRLIEALWAQVSRAPAAEQSTALNKFLNRFGVSRLEWLPRESVGKVVKTLQAMGAKRRSHASSSARTRSSSTAVGSA